MSELLLRVKALTEEVGGERAGELIGPVVEAASDDGLQDPKDDDEPLPQNRYENLPEEVKPEKLPKKLYHGTSTAKAKSIDDNGIDLNYSADSKNQFGRGFYLTRDFEVAKSFAQFADLDDDSGAVVLVYSTEDAEELNSLNKTELKGVHFRKWHPNLDVVFQDGSTGVDQYCLRTVRAVNSIKKVGEQEVESFSIETRVSLKYWVQKISSFYYCQKAQVLHYLENTEGIPCQLL